MPNDTTRGDALKARRTQAGLTQARLAGLASCSLTSIQIAEQGAVPARSAVLDRAEAVLDELEQAKAVTA